MFVECNNNNLYFTHDHHGTKKNKIKVQVGDLTFGLELTLTLRLTKLENNFVVVELLWAGIDGVTQAIEAVQ